MTENVKKELTRGGVHGVTQVKGVLCKVNKDIKSHTSNRKSRTVCSQVVCEKVSWCNGVATMGMGRLQL